MTTEHTPGPWEIVTNGNRTDIYAKIDHDHPSGPRNVSIAQNVRSEADARLLAAAPDLLEACRAISEQFVSIHAPARGAKIVQRARAALAKTEGGSR